MNTIHLNLSTLNRLTNDEMFALSDSLMSRIEHIVDKYLRLQLRYVYYDASFIASSRNIETSLYAKALVYQLIKFCRVVDDMMIMERRSEISSGSDAHIIISTGMAVRSTLRLPR